MCSGRSITFAILVAGPPAGKLMREADHSDSRFLVLTVQRSPAFSIAKSCVGTINLIEDENENEDDRHGSWKAALQTATMLTSFFGITITFFTVLPARNGFTLSEARAAASS